jgi:hypothetical protein
MSRAILFLTFKGGLIVRIVGFKVSGEHHELLEFALLEHTDEGTLECFGCGGGDFVELAALEDVAPLDESELDVMLRHATHAQHFH